MKFLLLPVAILFLLSQTFAQNELPGFGNFGGSELTLKECEFDKEADAIILFDVASGTYNDNHNLLINHRVRFKILKEKGIEYANIEIPYYSKDNFQTVTSVKAITYTPSENGPPVITPLDKKVVFRQKQNDVVTLLKFTVPNVKVGTIVDYEYEITSEHYGGLDDWYFQSDMPTVLSRFDLTMIPRLEFTYMVHKADNIPVKIKQDKGSGTIHFEMNNIGGLRNEPYMTSRKDYLQYVEFQFSGYVNVFGSKANYMTTWREVANDLLTDSKFGRLVNKKLSGSELIIEKANSFTNKFDKIKFLYDYVRTNFLWNKVYRRYASDGINDAWQDKKGTTAEINFILINLLKQADIDVDPMLVSERYQGKIATDKPAIDEFTEVVACAWADERMLVLDATSIYTPANIIPYSLLNTNAFIVNSKNPRVIKLEDKKSAVNFININTDIDKSGIISGICNINSFDYEKASRLKDYLRDKHKFQHEYFEKNIAEVRVDSLDVLNTEADSVALQQIFKFSMPASESGDYKLINTNLFSGFEKNPFIAENRFSDIDFGCRQNTSINEIFSLPENIVPEEMPKNIQMAMPDKSIVFIRMADYADNMITIQIALRINQTIFSAEDYPAVKEFYKKMYGFLNEQIVLKNKLTYE